jgi:uncharacterized membrane protein YjjP (DUF1212 family)
MPEEAESSFTPEVQRRIKQVELTIAENEEERKKLEKKISVYRSVYWLAAIGFFAGILLLALGLWWCSAILVPAGALAAITQSIKIRKLHRKVSEYDMLIKNARAYLRTLL